MQDKAEECSHCQHRANPGQRFGIIPGQIDGCVSGGNGFDDIVILFPTSKVHGADVGNLTNAVAAVADIVTFLIHIASILPKGKFSRRYCIRVPFAISKAVFPKEIHQNFVKNCL